MKKESPQPSKSKPDIRPGFFETLWKNVRFWNGLLVVVVLFYCVMLTLRTLNRGNDFMVYHEVARRFWSGVRPYDIETYGNLVFKYPPWVLPVFLPFGFLPLFYAKLAWGFVQSFSLISIVRVMRNRFRCSAKTQIFCLLAFFGVLGLQGMLGQISLPMLALVLWIDPFSARPVWVSFQVWALSAKIFSLFPMLAIFLARKDRLKWAFGSLGVFLVFSLPLYFGPYEHHSRWLREDWVKACFSGVENKARGLVEFTNREAQGLPSMVFRLFRLDQENRELVIGVVLVSLVAVAAFWFWRSRRLPDSARWLGWLALTPVIQPLGWIHFFIFAYPFSAWALEQEKQRAIPKRVYGVMFFILLAVAVTQKTLGQGLGGNLETISIKSIGVLWLVWLATSRRSSTR